MAKGKMKKETPPVGIEETRILYGTDGGGDESRHGAGPSPGIGSRNRIDPRRRAVSAGQLLPGSGLRRLTQVLTAAACGLALAILGGTLYAAFRDSGGPTVETPELLAGAGISTVDAAGSDPGVAELESRSPESAVFTGIGRLRIAAGAVSDTASSADPISRAVVVLSVVFPYPPRDRPFTEELAGKIPLFRRIIRDYFGALSRDELKPLDERRAKDELLRRFNAELQLGKIELLLFNELMILE